MCKQIDHTLTADSDKRSMSNSINCKFLLKICVWTGWTWYLSIKRQLLRSASGDAKVALVTPRWIWDALGQPKN